MAATQPAAASRLIRPINKDANGFSPKCTTNQALSLQYATAICKLKLRSNNGSRRSSLIRSQYASDYGVVASDEAEGRLDSSADAALNGLSDGIFESKKIPTIQAHPQSVLTELTMLSLPAIAGQAIEPLAQLMETAYIGRIGALELASVGVSISIFNIVSKVLNIPLLSVTTSFVAEDISINASKESSEVGNLKRNKNANSDNEPSERKLLPSVSTALFLAGAIGVFEALALYLGSGLFIHLMGITSASSMHIPARQFLSLRAIGAPAAVLSLAIQGIFRGFKDTKTPVFCLGVGNLLAVFLFPILMYYFGLGVTGAAISTVVSQYTVTFLMIWYLGKRTVLTFPRIKDLHFGGYLSSGGFLIGRTLAAVMTITLGTSMAAHQGPLAMAAHQICLQVWLSTSLLVDAQAASAQALIASSFAKRDYSRVKDITYCALKTGLFTGVALAIILGISFSFLATLFTKDTAVLGIIRSVAVFVSISQPVNALAYVFDGLHYGISDFSYAAWSMMAVGTVSSGLLLYASSVIGLSGVWLGLGLFMGLRTIAGYLRLSWKRGPWLFLQEDNPKSLRAAL